MAMLLKEEWMFFHYIAVVGGRHYVRLRVLRFIAGVASFLIKPDAKRGTIRWYA